MGKIMSLILFVVSAGLLVITFFFPFFTYNVGSYKGELVIGELATGEEIAINFKFNDEVVIKIGDNEYKGKYEIKDKVITITDCPESTIIGFNKLKMNNLFSLTPENIITGELLKVKLTSIFGIVMTAIYGVVAFISLVVFIVKLAR